MKNESNLNGLRILVVEDEIINSLLLTELLEIFEAQVVAVFDGEKAIEVFGNGENFDLVLMDIKLPKMDGNTLLTKLKSIKNIPIIAQTAFAMKGDKEKFLDSGFDDYISKPIEKKNLFEIISNIVKKSNILFF